MMPTPRTRRLRLILAAIDFSRDSARALRYAAALSRRFGGRVVAVHALDPLLEAAAARAYASHPLVEDTTIALKHFARKAIGVAAERVEYDVAIGAPRQALIAECRRRRPDVVVLGTQGRGGLAKMFFGSTTEALLRRYHGTVMVVPSKSPFPPPGWPGGTVVGAVGSGPHRRAMLSAAARTAEMFGAFLSVTSPDAPPARTRWSDAPLSILPLPDAARLGTFRQGTAAYEFVRRARGPVLVVRTGHRFGHSEVPRQAA